MPPGPARPIPWPPRRFPWARADVAAPDVVATRTAANKLAAALENLQAMVRGECPSLLNVMTTDEARRLSAQIDAAAVDAESTLATGFGESEAA